MAGSGIALPPGAGSASVARSERPHRPRNGGGIVSQASNRITWREKVGYGLGDTASNLYFQMFINFLLFFYTDVFGIPAAAAGTMLMLSRFWDAINDPLMGIITDRTHTRWGKFRP